MREIKFRGIVADDCEFDGDFIFKKGQMVFGHLIRDDKGQPYILGDMIEVDNEMTIFESWIAVDEESVSQYSGIKDKTGKEVFEGDIVESLDWNPMRYKVGFNRGGFCIFNEGDFFYTDIKYVESDFTVIGNIHENPDLLPHPPY